MLQNLDLPSLETFKRLNSTSNAIMNSLPTYRALRRHAPEILPVLAVTRLLAHFTASQIFEVLRTARCTACTHRYTLGPYVFLPRFYRCCQHCLQYNPDLQVIETIEAKLCYGLTKKQLNILALLWTIPGSLSMENKVYVKPISLVCTRQARNLGIKIHGSWEKMQRFVTRKFLNTDSQRKNPAGADHL